MTRLAEKILTFANSKTASLLLLFGFFYIVAAASHSGFMEKWALRDEGGNLSIISMLNGTADKPFVYRQLVPILAKTLQPVIAESNSIIFIKLRKFLEYNLNPQDSFSRATSANITGYEYSYRIVCWANFLALLSSLFILRSLAFIYGFSSVESTIAPAAFILAFPYIQTMGGYFYDSIELAFFCMTILLATKGRVVLLAILVIFATLNKESFLFFIPSIYPFLRAIFSQKRAIINLIIFLIFSGLVNAYIKFIFIDNGGDFVQIHIWEHLRSYSILSSYFKYETTYGLPSPSGFFIMTLTFIFIILVRGWHDIPLVWKQHLKIAVIINTPLFLAFCANGELRNLSYVFVGFVILIVAAIKVTVNATSTIKF